MGTSLLLHVLYGTMMHSIQLFRPISLCFSGTAPLMIGVDADQWDQYTSVIDQCVLFCFFEIQFKPGGAKFKQKSKCFFFFHQAVQLIYFSTNIGIFIQAVMQPFVIFFFSHDVLEYYR